MENKVKVWIARDKDGKLFAYSERPKKNVIYRWVDMGLNSFELDCTRFPSVKWEDDEPTEAYITLAETQEQPKQEQPTPKQEIDWEQRRYEIAKEMGLELYRQKAVVITHHVQGINLKDIADFAVVYTDRLIEKLKKGGNDE